MFDSERFIDYIREHPPLWDKGVVEYSDRTARNESWHAVGQSMYGDWNAVPPMERAARVMEMKNKWRHIRDNFFRDLHQGKSGGDAPKKRKKKYMYADALTFLLNYSTRKQSPENLCDESNDDNLDDVEDQQDSGELKHAIDVLEIIAQPSKTSRTTADDECQISSKLPTFQHEQSKRLEYITEVEEDDSDRHFLLSLLPDLRDLNQDEKLDFKLMTIQFFRDIRRKRQSSN